MAANDNNAGGFGALMNYDRTQQAFGDTPVYLLDDSGPPLADPYLTPCLQQMFRTMWNLDSVLPEGCTECREPGGGGLENALPYLADKYPDRRLALITSTRDGTIRSFYGYGYPDCQAGASGFPMPEDAFAEGIAHMSGETLAGHDNFRVYAKDSGMHVWLLFSPVTISPRPDGSGVVLADWLEDMFDPDSDWKSVAP